MKRILASLLVLALCAPAMAATVTINDGGDGTGTIVVDADGAGSIVGLALNIDATGGNITVLSIDGTLNPTFNIYPDAAYSEELGDGYTYGEGTPIADQDAAGQVALSNSVCVSVGCLNGELIAGADGATSVTINIEVDADTNVCVEENALRGGIILTDGTAVDIDGGQVCGDITVVSECMAATNPDYAAWTAAGKPDCWCYSQNCKGDAVGIAQFGVFWVLSDDIPVFAGAYGKNDASLPPNGECANFDHAKQFGTFQVLSDDLAILAANYGNNALAPCSGPGTDEPGADANPLPNTEFNFWTN